MELEYMLALDTNAERIKGSSPFLPTNLNRCLEPM